MEAVPLPSVCSGVRHHQVWKTDAEKKSCCCPLSQ